VAAARYKTITSDRHLKAAANALSQQCKVMSAVYARTGTPPLRDFPANFQGLAKIVTGQQLSAASASAIWNRVASSIQPFEAEALLAMPDRELAALGLSGGKIRTLKAVATAVSDGEIDIDGLALAPEEDVIDRLTALHGIGPWTADIYLLFALRRADAFASGDLALQLAAQRLFKLKDRPTPAKLEAIAERWRPWRAVAARLLWADYGLEKSKRPRSTAKSTLRKPAK
jgi:DNA-3-methyladenine glycosylase II